MTALFWGLFAFAYPEIKWESKNISNLRTLECTEAQSTINAAARPIATSAEDHIAVGHNVKCDLLADLWTKATLKNMRMENTSNTCENSEISSIEFDHSI